MDYDIILSGVKIGEHSPDPAGFIEDIKTRVITSGCNYAAQGQALPNRCRDCGTGATKKQSPFGFRRRLFLSVPGP